MFSCTEHISGGEHFGDADTSTSDYQLENLYGLTWIYFSWLYFLRHKNILGRLHCWEHRREYKKDQFRQKHTETILPLFLHSHKMLFYHPRWDVYALARASQTLEPSEWPSRTGWVTEDNRSSLVKPFTEAGIGLFERIAILSANKLEFISFRITLPWSLPVLILSL